MTFMFDPSVGTGAFMLLSAAIVTELSMQTADLAAERGDDAMADNFWQMGVMVVNG